MTHSLLTQDDSALRAKAKKHLMNPIRLYSLFMKVNGEWVRVRETSYSEKLALRVWMNELADLNKSIRPIKIISMKAQGISRFSSYLVSKEN